MRSKCQARRVAKDSDPAFSEITDPVADSGSADIESPSGIDADASQVSDVEALQGVVGDISQVSDIEALQSVVGDVSQVSDIKALQSIVGDVSQVSDIEALQSVVGDVSQVSDIEALQGVVGDVSQKDDSSFHGDSKDLHLISPNDIQTDFYRTALTFMYSSEQPGTSNLQHAGHISEKGTSSLQKTENSPEGMKLITATSLGFATDSLAVANNQAEPIPSASFPNKPTKNNESSASSNIEDPFIDDFMLKSLDDSQPGVWTRVRLEAGKLIGPMSSDDDRMKSDRNSKLMKFIQKSDNTETSNLMAVHLQNQLYYRAIREIQAGEEMLLYAKDRFYQEPDFTGLFQKKSEEVETSMPCSECGEIFKDPMSLHKHQLFSCNNSRSDYGHNQNLSGDEMKCVDGQFSPMAPHERDTPEHIDGGDFKCEECPRSFTLKSNLARHQIVHESGRRFSCEHCERHFTDPSNLQRHIRSQHHGARCHACTDCGKTFATSSGLKQHQHIHSSVKPFQCEVCLKAYTQFSNLCRHKRMHADCRQQIKCNDCGQAFSTITSLSKHKRFCEGALRNGMRLGGFGAESKMAPSTGLPGANQTPFSPALMMGLYSSRPAFPFYPPCLGNMPMFPAGHPLTALTALSPSSLRSPELHHMTPDKPDLSPAEKYEKRALEGSDGGSEFMSGSDLDNIPSDSESEKSTGISQHSLDTHTVSVTMPKPIAFIPVSMTSQMHNISPRAFFPPRMSPLPPSEMKHSTAECAYDLSKPSVEDYVTPPKVTLNVSHTEVKADGELPLDLSQTKDLTPPEAPRKTHIFGDIKTPVTPEPRLHYAYPQFPKQLMMEQALRLAEHKDKSPIDPNNFLRYPRFPFTGPPQYPVGINPFSFISQASPKSLTSVSSMSSMSPQGKPFTDFGGSPTHIGQFSTPNKLKDRYSCKFCGKVFPRSANLTRHLRTHTGEQPYKCKYCERSFSISSNLQRHVRNIHNKEKPFRCPLCDRCFGQQTNLDRHLKKHETDGPNIVDSPERIDERETELDDKDESYFSEIRNFIGKATNMNGQPDINQNSLSVVELKHRVELLQREKIPSESDEEIDPVSDDHGEKLVKSDDVRIDVEGDLESGEPDMKKARMSDKIMVSTTYPANEDPLPLCKKPGFELKRGFSPVLCS